MYYCETCHIMDKIKPYRENNCDYCGSKTIIKLSKKTNITIEHIDLQSSYNAIINEFYTINNFESSSARTSLDSVTRKRLFSIDLNEYANKRSYGYIYDNITDFTALSRPDLDHIWLKLFGKISLTYYIYNYVRIKCSLYEHYILVPMSLTTIIDWFNDNSKTYHVIYNKSIWVIEQLSDTDITTPLTNRLFENGRIQNTKNRNHHDTNLTFIS